MLPFGGTSELVTSGVYRFTRNPMYLGMTLAYAGSTLLLNSVWCALFVPAALIRFMYWLFVPKNDIYPKNSATSTRGTRQQSVDGSKPCRVASTPCEVPPRTESRAHLSTVPLAGLVFSIVLGAAAGAWVALSI